MTPSPYAVPPPRTGALDHDIAEALAGLLDVPAPAAELPPFWHWTYLLERPAQAALGADGHPAPTEPGAPGTTRMFAGGRLTTLAALRLGRPAHRQSSVEGVRTTTGRSGELTFVTVRHVISQNDTVCLIDEQDLVYRSRRATPPPDPGSPTPTAGPSGALALRCDPVLLFRFSALTYNAHRIHYDVEYARAEGYPGLVIHGPLQVLLMAETLRRAGHHFDDTCFEYRLIAPAFAPQVVTTSSGDDDGVPRTDVRTANGTRTATARLLPRPVDE